ncbi:MULTISPECIES: DUF6074 family protein [Nitratireductor]|uniref:DUF6074 family protein n=1 Tax=Nitratireductor TaxID=245876 RepID=UPI000D0D169B|nr:MULTISPECIES: DUF6074 family protein [Nitratireductor]PSM16752.1 hypothetical protein C7T96_18945 [Nitratireductor sp. StC3]
MKADHDSQGDGAHSARVVAFPLWRRADAVARAARALAALGDLDARDDYRHRLAARFFAELDALGLSEADQDEEVGAFFYEVEFALEDLFGEALKDVTTGMV